MILILISFPSLKKKKKEIIKKKSSYLERLGEKVALLDVVLWRIDQVNIVEPREPPWNTAVFLESLNGLPSPFTVLGILCQPPHHEVRLEGLKEKYFYLSEYLGGPPCLSRRNHAKKNGLNISAFITGRENSRK